MKLLRRNDKSNNRGNRSHSEEILQIKAISLMQELEKMRRRKNEEIIDQPSSDRQHPLDPKRLLCFSGKPKKDKYKDCKLDTEASWEKSPWKSENSNTTNKYNKNSQELAVRDTRRNNGDIADICNELCQDYYEIRKKLRNRPIVLTNKKFQMDSTTGSTSTTSSFDAPLRKFHDDDKKKKRHPRGRKYLHFSNENRELHRRQPSLLDDNGSVQNQKTKSESNKSNEKKSMSSGFKKSTSSSFNSWRTGSNKNSNQKPKSNTTKNSRSENKKSNSLKSNNNRPNIVWEDSPEMKGSGSISYTIPISVFERKSQRDDMQPDLSMISTLSTSSYTTCDESGVILSPRVANEKVERHSIPSQGMVDSNLGLVCGPITCVSTQQQSRLLTNRNPIVQGVALANLGTITEGYAYASMSSSSSFSSYSSSSFSNHSGGFNNESESNGEEYDQSVIYDHDYAVKAIKATSKIGTKKGTVNGGCTIAGGEIWNMFDDDTNSIVASDRDVDQRDDYY